MIVGKPSTINDDYQLNVIKILKHAAKVYPKREIASRSIFGIHRYSYSQAYERVCAIANALEKLGIKPGDAVGLLGFNTHRFYESYFSIPGLGAVLLPLNLRLPPQDLLYILKHSEVKGLLVDDFMVPIAEMIAPQHDFDFFVIMSERKEVDTKLDPAYSYEELVEGNEKTRDWDEIDERSAATACYTSGTTGKPKGIYFSHRSIYLHALTGAAYLRIGAEDCYMQIVPMFHANGWGGHIGATMVGSKLVFPGFFTLENVDVLMDLIVKEGVTVTHAAPVILIPMLEYLRKLDPKPDLTGLRIGSGASEPPVAMMKGFAEFGVEIIHAYGATETSPLVTLNFIKPDLELSEEEYWEYKKFQGLPVLGVEVKVMTGDREGQEAPWDGKTMGELWIRGIWVTKEYYRDERTKDSFADGWWKSGDVAVITPEGYVKIVDRVKDVIKSGGEWISSVDLENTLMAHPAVLEACVIGVEHPKWQERPLAFVVLKPGEEAMKEELIEFLKSRFAKWQVPDDILFVDEIPKTSVGKFDKRALREKYRKYLIEKSG